MQEKKPKRKTKTGTEADTFRRLKRIDFDELSYRLVSMDDKVYNTMSEDEFEEFFNSVGWTVDEYSRQNTIRFNRILNQMKI